VSATETACNTSAREPYADLKKITHPVVVTNGNNDIMIPTVNSFTLSAHLPDAQLIIAYTKEKVIDRMRNIRVVRVYVCHPPPRAR
jgi:pimeloyl-ACP methyl ester carboxylesterase